MADDEQPPFLCAEQLFHDLTMVICNLIKMVVMQPINECDRMPIGMAVGLLVRTPERYADAAENGRRVTSADDLIDIARTPATLAIQSAVVVMRERQTCDGTDHCACWRCIEIPAAWKRMMGAVEAANNVIVTTNDGHGETLMQLACSWGCIDSTRTLLAMGADPNAHAGPFGLTPLHCAINRFYNEGDEPQDRIGLVGMLIRAGADVNATTPHGSNAIRMAIRCNMVGCAGLLLDEGARVDETADRNGDTFIGFTLTYDMFDMARLLLRHGVDVDAMSFDEWEVGCDHARAEHADDILERLNESKHARD